MSDFHPCCPAPTGLVRPVRVDPEGITGPPRGVAAGPRWRTSSHGLVVPVGVPLTVEQRILEAAVRLSEDAMVTGWAALRLAGAAYFEGLAPDGHTLLPVPVLLPHTSRIRGKGVHVERTRRPLPAVVMRYAVPCAPTGLALLHEVRRATTLRRAGVMVDMALASGAVDLARLRVTARGRSLPEVAAYALRRACAECRSPKESEMLQLWEEDLGFPRPLMNREVLDLSDRVIAVVDLLDDASGTYGEYNGAAHRSRERQRRDEARAADLRDVGLEGFVLVAGDSERVWKARMHAARGRALWLPAEQRQWRSGEFVPAPPLPDADEAAVDAMMLEYHRSLE